MFNLKHDVEVCYTLASMDLKLKYQNSKLGFLWSFFKPLLQFVTYYIVFGIILKYSDSADYPLRLFLGVLLWSFFSEATSLGLNSYVGKKSIITKIHIKKELIPIAAGITAIFSYLLNMCIFLLTYHAVTEDFYKIYTLKNLVVFLTFWGSLCVFVISINIILANLNVLFRDVQNIWDIMLTYGCFLTPIVYTLPIPEKYLLLYYFVNPLAMSIESIRTIFFDADIFLWKNSSYVIVYFSSILMWTFIAALVDNKLQRKVADYL